MPLKQGSSDKVIQENIRCILEKDGCGYDPPYMDRSRKEYTPAQAAAIAYAKAGRRNNAGGYTGSPDKEYKAPKNDKKQDGDPKWWKQEGVKVPGVKPKDSAPEGDGEKEAKKPQGKPQAKPIAKPQEKVPSEISQAYPNNQIDDAYWNKLSKPEKDWFLNKAKEKLSQTQAKPQPQVPEGWSTQQQSNQKPQFKGNQLVINGRTYNPGKTLPGSTSPVLYTDDKGAGAWVVKEGGADGQNTAEYAANKVYQTLSASLPIGSLDSQLVNGRLINKFIRDGKTLGQLSPQEIKQFDIAKKMRSTHLADALVANWDFAGLNNDNIMVNSKGELIRIDTGGTFNFRAQGAQKNYTPMPMEIWSLRESSQGKQFWANASEEDYKDLWTNQIKAIMSKRIELDKVIDASGLDEKTANNFRARIDSYVVAWRAVDYYLNTEGEPQSWKAIDQALRKSFLATSKAVDEGNNNSVYLAQLKKELQKQLSSVSSGMPTGITDKTFLDNLKILQTAFPKIKWDQDQWDSLTPDLKNTYINAAKSTVARQNKQQQPQGTPTTSQKPISAKKKIDWSLYDGVSIDDISGLSNMKTVVASVDYRLNSKDNSAYIKEFGDPKPLMALSNDHKFVLRKYTGSLYRPLNEYLRYPDKSDKDLHPFLANIAEVMDEALANLPDNTNKNEFWRMNRVGNERTETIQKIMNLKPGDVYSTNTFDSYTDDNNGNERIRNETMDAFYRSGKFNFITMYRGNKVKLVAPASGIEDERESLLPRNTELRVAEIKDEPISNYKGISWGGKEASSGVVKVIYLEDL